MVKLTREQRLSVFRIWQRDSQGLGYREFRKTVKGGTFDCVMVHWCGMWLGIEHDGYTHS